MPRQNWSKSGCLAQSNSSVKQAVHATLSQVSGIQGMPIFPTSSQQEPTSVQTMLDRQPIIFAQFDAVARDRPIAYELPSFTTTLGQ